MENKELRETTLLWWINEFFWTGIAIVGGICLERFWISKL